MGYISTLQHLREGKCLENICSPEICVLILNSWNSLYGPHFTFNNEDGSYPLRTTVNNSMSSEEKLWLAIIFPGSSWSSGQKIIKCNFWKGNLEKPIICTELVYNIVFVRLHICRKIQRLLPSKLMFLIEISFKS